MARPLRTDFPNALHHVTSRGNEQRPIFFADDDRVTFLAFLGEAVQRFGWSVTAFVLMTNHFHLVVQTPDANLSRGMHWLNGTYAGWFNRRYKRCGHLFQGRFKAKLIEKERYFHNVLRYVVLNPVRANMVERPEDYRWSSYRATAGLEAAPEWLDLESAFGGFAPERGLAQTYYRDFVEQGVGADEKLWEQLIHGMFLGTAGWAKQMRKLVESKPRSSDHPALQRSVGRPRKMDTVIRAVAKVAGVTAAEIRGGRGGPLRRLAAWIGWNEGWLTLRSMAAALRLRSEGHVSGMIRRADAEFGLDRELLSLLDSSLAMLRA